MIIRGIFAGALLIALASEATAQLRISVTEGFTEPLQIAVTEFTINGDDPNADVVTADAPYDAGSFESRLADLAHDIPQIIQQDLASSGLFVPTAPLAFLVDMVDFEAVPDFLIHWRPLGVSALLYGDVRKDPNAPDGVTSRVEVRIRLWDVFSQQYLLGRRYTFDHVDHRSVGHRIADAVYTELTAEQPYFNTRILYVAGRGNVRRLAIMDSDGANHRYLPSGGGIPLTPRFSSDLQAVTYLFLSDKSSRVFHHRLDTGVRTDLGQFDGLYFAPRFVPQSQDIIFSFASPENPGNTDVWKMNIITRRFQRITSHPAIDISPSFSPDGKHFAMTSDRSGSQQIYTQLADGSEATRITFGKGNFSTPVWSPRGDLIAFTRQLDGQFAIGVMRTDGTAVRILDERWHIEGPTWSPNGRVLMYFSENPASDGGGAYGRLHSVDLTGQNKRNIETPGAASDPAWSPLLN